MSLRLFIGVIGVLLVVAGGIGLFVGISPSTQPSISCGSAAAPNYSAAKDKDEVNSLGRTLSGGKDFFDKTDLAGECRRSVGGRRAWTIPLAAVGVIAAIGAAVLRSPART